MHRHYTHTHTHTTQDLFGTLLFGLLYTIASLAWSIGAAQLDSYVATLLNNYAANCLVCSGSLGLINTRTQPFTQVAISAVSGLSIGQVYVY